MRTMRFEVINISPEMAAKMLEKNENNRKLREPRAVQIARAITQKKWRLTHQAIAISPKGRLLDGQHRLRAICLANQTVPAVVAYDVPENTFGVIDAGLPRKMYERLRSDPKNTTISNKLFQLMIGRKNPQEFEIQTMMDVMGPAMAKIGQVQGPNKSRGGRLSKASQEAAVVLRMAQAIRDGDDDAQININWKLEKVRRGDMAGAPPMIVAFSKQLVEGVHNPDIMVSRDTDDFCRTWRAFDREREQTNRLQIDDHLYVIREARDVFREVSEGIFE